MNVCKKHWRINTETIKLPGGYTRPAGAPSIFNAPSRLPIPKPMPRPA